MRQGDITYIAVPRTEYWFGHRAYSDGAGNGHAPLATERPYVSDPLDDRPVYGVAISDRSEVRGVRVGVLDVGDPTPGAAFASELLELEEGAPLPLMGGPRSRLVLDRLRWTDGRLVLAVARTAEAVAALPVSLHLFPATRFKEETLAANQRVFLHGGALLTRLRATYLLYNHDALLAPVATAGYGIQDANDTDTARAAYLLTDAAAAAAALPALARSTNTGSAVYAGNFAYLSIAAAVKITGELTLRSSE